MKNLIKTTAINSSVETVNSKNWMKTAAAETLYQQTIEDHGFIYGMNFPWSSGHMADLGDCQTFDAKCRFNEMTVRKSFYNLGKLGFDCVTYWLFNSGTGLEYDETGDVTGVQDIFLENLEKVLKYARQYNVKLNLTIQPHFDYTVESGAYGGSKEKYDKYTRFIVDPSVRKNYIEKAVTPTLKLINEYRDTVFSIMAYCEPELDIYGPNNGYQTFGTSPKVMRDFIRELVKVSREEVTNIPVWVTAAWLREDTVPYYNEMDLDFVGRDVYNNEGEAPNVEKMRLTLPIVMGEFRSIDETTTTSSFYKNSFNDFIKNAKEAGYTGAFYWCYIGGLRHGFIKDTADPTQYSTLIPHIYYYIKDDLNQQKGIEDILDNPVMLYPDVDSTLQFIASRDAYQYIIERSTDGENWIEIETIFADKADPDGENLGAYKDKTAEPEVYYTYRITAVDRDGKKAVSDVSISYKSGNSLCDPEDNLINDYSFENVTDIIELTTAGQWSLVEGTAGNETFSGNKAIKIIGDGETSTNSCVAIEVNNLKPNTYYTYIFHAKSECGVLKYKILGGSLSKNPQYTNGEGKYFETYTSNYEHLWGKWKRYTYNFNSKNNTSITFVFEDGSGIVTIDDLYLFEQKD